MKKIKTLSFVLTLPLSYEEWQKVKLDTLFRVCGEASNNLISDRRKALEQLERTKQWKTVQTKIAQLRDQQKKSSLTRKRPPRCWRHGMSGALICWRSSDSPSMHFNVG